MADKIDFATVSYVLGILSIVFAFFSPVAGLALGIVGLVQSKKNKVERARKLNKLGIVLSTIFIIISILVLIFATQAGIDSGSFPLF